MILDRIDRALKGGPLSYAALAREVFPRDRYPRAFNYQSNGGPPGCYMALSAALRKGKYYVEHQGVGAGNRRVHPRKGRRS